MMQRPGQMNRGPLLSRRGVIWGSVSALVAGIDTRRIAPQLLESSTGCDAAVEQPWTKFGINIVGPALSAGRRGSYGRDYIYPDRTALTYYRSKGFRVARVTFLWERMQPQLLSDLESAELGRLQALAATARAHGMVLVTGPHNYARYAVEDGKPELIGGPKVPLAAFADLWRRLSTSFISAGQDVVFELMNEPHDTAGTWPAMAQAAVDAIRKVDRNRWIYVAGDGWSSAQSWRRYNDGLAIRDPSDRIVYVAHQYFDGSGKGAYETGYDADGAYPEIGAERLKPFVEWLRERGVRGTMTEYGVPNTDPRWLVVLDKALDTLKQADVGGAYWAGGPWWGDYPLSSEPREGHDAPVMAVLTKYTQPCSSSRSEGPDPERKAN
jgi:endoglucanase